MLKAKLTAADGGNHTGRRGKIPLFLALALAFFSLILVTSCDRGNSLYVTGTHASRSELRELFSLLEKNLDLTGEAASDTKYALSRRIAATLVKEGEPAKAAAFLMRYADAKDPYYGWYIFTAGALFEEQGEIELAVPLYERLVKIAPDLLVEGQSLHREALSRLVEFAQAPERRIEYYRDYIARFPDSAETGAYRFLLAKEYEKVGSWDEALKSYASFLPYIGVEVPGYPDAHSSARQILEFNASSKDWTQENLETLVSSIRTALSSGSARQLRKFASKAGFFAVSWYQDSGEDANSKVNFDLAQFMQGKKIQSSPTLHPSSGSYEAYVRTWGWAGRVPVWYLYFRKIDFPADPDIHGRWEWAGIYFGEKMQ